MNFFYTLTLNKTTVVIHSLFRHNALVSLYKKRFYVSSKGLPFLFSIDERMDCHAWYIIK